MKGIAAIALAAALAAGMPLVARGQPQATPAAVISDPPRDAAHPAANKQLLIPSHGKGMNALFFLAAGEGPKPTMLLLHGLPGNERNLDLAQAVRRAGWNVLTFTYRGAWGSPGDFSISNAIEDSQAALDYLRSPEAARAYNIDPERIVIAGHSMGGLAAAITAARSSGLEGLVLIDAWDAGATAAEMKVAPEKGRQAFIAQADDFGNALQGATPAAIADELLARGGDWNIVPLAPELAREPVLSVYATYGIAADNRRLAEALRRQPRARVEAVELPTDHSFSDHRIALEAAVVSWLQRLGAGRASSR